MRVLAIALILILLSGVVHAQETDTPTPEPTPTPTATLTATETLTPTPDVAHYDTIDDQPFRIDYVVSAGDLMIGLLLLLLLFSVWGFAVLGITTGTKHD